ncbi:MAG: hypothetical protein ACOYVF_11495 [Candidatus Zixiibacteriota bacterium]
MKTKARNFRQLTLPLLIPVMLCLILTTSVAGSEFKKGDKVEISKLHQIDDDFYFYGEELTVDGLIKGDLMAFAFSINLRGHLERSVNVFSYQLNHQGIIDGSLRAFARTAELQGYIGRSALVSAQNIILTPGAMIKNDANFFGAKAALEGSVLGDVAIAADTVYIAGIIEGNAEIWGSVITVSPPAVIKGNLKYHSPGEAFIDTASGVSILGETVWVKPENKEKSETFNPTSLIIRIACLLATFIFAVIAYRLFRPYAEESFFQLKNRFTVAFAAGVLTFLIVLISFTVLLFSLIMALIGIILISEETFLFGSLILAVFTLLIPITSFATVSGGVAFYSGKIIIAALIGYFLTGRFRKHRVDLSKTSLFAGLLILLALFSIPYVGLYIYLLVCITGAGAIILGVMKCNRMKKDQLSYPPESADHQSSPQ